MEHVEIKKFFPTPIVCCHLGPLGAPIAELRRCILEHSEASPGVVHSNDGGWQSAADFQTWGGAAGAWVIGAAQTAIDRFTVSHVGNALERKLIEWRVDAWANVNRRGDRNLPHCHAGAYWSSTFYVDDGGIAGQPTYGGAIQFDDPRGNAPMMYAPALKMAIPDCVTAGLGEQIFPTTGMLLLFPAWINHSVTRYLGTGTRISLTMNFSL